MGRSMEQVLMRFKADYDVVLECIQEVYGLEGDNLRLGKDFRKTMVLPFMKMLERHCGGEARTILNRGISLKAPSTWLLPPVCIDQIPGYRHSRHGLHEILQPLRKRSDGK